MKGPFLSHVSTQPMVGTQVYVYRLKFSQCPSILGRATIIREIDRDLQLYEVRFYGERTTRLAIVNGGAFQTDADAMQDALTAHFRVSVDPSLLFNPHTLIKPKR